LGGDEFVIVARHVDSEAGVLTVANHVHAVLAGIRSVAGYPVSVSASIGACLLPVATSRPPDVGSILRAADIAMYRAKAKGRGQTEIANSDEGAPASSAAIHTASGAVQLRSPCAA
jgi:diguanylate cyclase (GGDEF)-like protein